MGERSGNSSSIEDSTSDEKWWDVDILDQYDRETEDWQAIVDHLPSVRTEDGSPPSRAQLRFWYLQLQPKQRWAYSVFRESAESLG